MQGHELVKHFVMMVLEGMRIDSSEFHPLSLHVFYVILWCYFSCLGKRENVLQLV